MYLYRFDVFALSVVVVVEEVRAPRCHTTLRLPKNHRIQSSTSPPAATHLVQFAVIGGGGGRSDSPPYGD